jgi:hypothetical protein
MTPGTKWHQVLNDNGVSECPLDGSEIAIQLGCCAHNSSMLIAGLDATPVSIGGDQIWLGASKMRNGTIQWTVVKQVVYSIWLALTTIRPAESTEESTDESIVERLLHQQNRCMSLYVRSFPGINYKMMEDFPHPKKNIFREWEALFLIRRMGWSLEAIIALITLLITGPPSLVLLWIHFQERRGSTPSGKFHFCP